ncbi:hypothetical protein [Dyella nitratireducens]|uniref:Uncharacterized protein n=1 Tax=Dyella nitratireducens TaxID=1849580 RepID=A0ABQ1GPD6_9GAMM|nr:hypothetical protein [Dyella nitratireducens]GGA47414.1 hypothetical protein GCM10010981_40680 [Dyella nitratireducens]GLQ42454.1 hypothetical protein GCM10007902_23040 [Dyella nitratireducens]
MSVPFDSGAPSHLRAQRIVLFAVLVALALATADLLFACTFWQALYHVPPLRIMQNIAAGLLGKRAFLGGSSTVVLGALLHYAIMGVMVGVYYLASRRRRVLIERPWLYGSLYGLVLFVVMNLIVVPLSAAPKAPVVLSWIVSSIVVHVFIGLVIALSARRAT